MQHQGVFSLLGSIWSREQLFRPRSGIILIPPCTDLSLLLAPSSGVLEEAEFYNIASLVRLVKERIRDNENRTSQVTHVCSHSLPPEQLLGLGVTSAGERVLVGGPSQWRVSGRGAKHRPSR